MINTQNYPINFTVGKSCVMFYRAFCGTTPPCLLNLWWAVQILSVTYDSNLIGEFCSAPGNSAAPSNFTNFVNLNMASTNNMRIIFQLNTM